MPDISANNKRIAKNTILLYFRTILIMLVTLYTSRIVLNTLGVKDYGVYNAVGGFVTMFSLISGSLSNAISRYITYGIGKNDKDKLRVIFCTSVNIQILISVIIFILCEVAGFWFLNYKMNIPEGRLNAANWVLHFSLLTFVVNLISVPYNACIIAYERMDAYAFISIFDAILKLSVAYLLIISPIDKLVVYALLLLITSVLVRILYGIYCGRNFAECKYHSVLDKKLFNEMLGFAGWNFLGNGSSVLNNQGITLLINVFFGVVLNTARGIASQVETAVNQFVGSFTTAINPQITKAYATGDKERVFYLVCKGAKFSYFLMLLFVVPIFIETEYILKLWLNIVPEQTSTFVRLTLFGSMVAILGNTGYTACLATGKIKKYSIYITLVGSMAFIGTWMSYYCGLPVESAYFCYIIVYTLVLIVKLLLMKSMLGLPIRMFVEQVLLKIILPTILCFLLPMFIKEIFETSYLQLITITLFSLFWTGVCVCVLGLTKGEKAIIVTKGNAILNKFIK